MINSVDIDKLIEIVGENNDVTYKSLRINLGLSRWARLAKNTDTNYVKLGRAARRRYQWDWSIKEYAKRYYVHRELRYVRIEDSILLRDWRFAEWLKGKHSKPSYLW